jgi:hypothetical protein
MHSTCYKQAWHDISSWELVDSTCWPHTTWHLSRRPRVYHLVGWIEPNLQVERFSYLRKHRTFMVKEENIAYRHRSWHTELKSINKTKDRHTTSSTRPCCMIHIKLSKWYQGMHPHRQSNVALVTFKQMFILMDVKTIFCRGSRLLRTKFVWR